MRKLFLILPIALMLVACNGKQPKETVTSNNTSKTTIVVPQFNADTAYQYVANGFRSDLGDRSLRAAPPVPQTAPVPAVGEGLAPPGRKSPIPKQGQANSYTDTNSPVLINL